MSRRHKGVSAFVLRGRELYIEKQHGDKNSTLDCNKNEDLETEYIIVTENK